jgi:hypothetical protein
VIRFSPTLLSVLGVAIGAAACGGDDSGDEGASGMGGGAGIAVGTGGGKSGTGGLGSGGASSGGAGSSGMGSGGIGTGGTTITGGTAGAGAGMGGTSTGGVTGTQPLGSICANDGNCSQTEGAAVCCQSTCALQADCPGGTFYLACESGSDCDRYSGGFLCCRANAGGEPMQYCTKQNGCLGTPVP